MATGEIAEADTDPSSWSREKLVARVTQLERELQELKEQHAGRGSGRQADVPPKPAGAARKFDPSRYSTRLIALKFAYLGHKYNGFEHTANVKTLYPSIEETLWKALVKGHLISPPGSEDPDTASLNWEGCEYSKCGRTDKGVSAFGQVIGIRVRSRRPLQKATDAEPVSEEDEFSSNGAQEQAMQSKRSATPYAPLIPEGEAQPQQAETSSFDPIHDEMPYPVILNRLLPPDIRVLAWCPSPPEGFSARFACRERQYHYFFTQPAFSPSPGRVGLDCARARDPATGAAIREGWLDIAAMQRAARKYEGLHDFRNLCKVDPTKQLDAFDRRVFRSEIRAVDAASDAAAYVHDPAFSRTAGLDRPEASGVGGGGGPQVYEFVLHGSAFLWHQVRHMVAILFLIGQGLEKPELVDQLLDTKENPRRPVYGMADDAPLVLWDCIFPHADDPERKDALDWVYVGAQAGDSKGKRKRGEAVPGKGRFGMGGVVDGAWALWREKKMEDIMAGSMLNVVTRLGKSSDEDLERMAQGGLASGTANSSQRVFAGGNAAKLAGEYMPVMQRPRQEAVETVNARWLARKGGEHRSVPGEVRPTGRGSDIRGDHVQSSIEP